MSDKTGIQWCDATWNPTSGCDRVSPGCDHCYAMTLAKRLKAMGSPRYQVDGDPRTSGPGFGVQAHAVALDQPLRWTKPRRIFVNSMSDLFHDQVPTEFIAEVFAIMAACPQHTFQVLTKRHGRMRSLLNSAEFRDTVTIWATAVMRKHDSSPRIIPSETWPLPNVWLGVSAEDQPWADIRVAALEATPAAVRFVSAEPLLGPVTFRWAKWLGQEPGDRHHLDGLRKIDWLIIGGESGPGARPMDPDWARSLVSECQEAGVAPFVKQLGACWAREHGGDSHGGDWDLWPADLRIREFPTPVPAAA